MPDPQRLLADEAEGAARFDAAMARIPEDRRADPTVTPDGWTPIMLAAHMSGWLDLRILLKTVWLLVTGHGLAPD